MYSVLFRQGAKITVQDEDTSVRKAAVDKLTDQEILVRIALEDQSPDVRKVALEKVIDNKVVAKIAVQDVDNVF